MSESSNSSASTDIPVSVSVPTSTSTSASTSTSNTIPIPTSTSTSNSNSNSTSTSTSNSNSTLSSQLISINNQLRAQLLSSALKSSLLGASCGIGLSFLLFRRKQKKTFLSLTLDWIFR
jgi:hypothetical protein